MSEIVDRVVAAIEAERRKRMKFGNHGITDAEAYGRVAIAAMREPTDAMVDAAPIDAGPRRTWETMLDEAMR